MADHLKIYPTPDPEAPPSQPTAPLAPPSTFQSEKGDPDSRHPPPPYAAYSKPPKRRNCCCRCLCWLLCLILVIIIILGILVGVFFLVFQPKLPKYSVDSLKITQFGLNNDILYATFNVNITARNPNKKIGIYYENGSHLNVFYKGTELCEGSLPKFYQGHRNTTVLNVELTGQTENATGLLQSLQEEQQQTGIVPLNLRAKVPVRIKVGKLKLMKWKFLVKCTLDVDSLSADNVIRIRNNHCKFRFRF